jgi:hypothetical protein
MASDGCQNKRYFFHLRISVRFNNLSPTIERKPDLSLRQMAIAVGGASFGYVLLGLLLLRVFQQMCVLSS